MRPTLSGEQSWDCVFWPDWIEAVPLMSFENEGRTLYDFRQRTLL